MSSQHAYRVRFGWGQGAITALARPTDAVVIVDVLSFSTAVDIATVRGAAVVPWASGRGGVATLAAGHDAVVAVRRGDETADQPYTLSPVSLMGIPAGTRLVLPSPNGSALSADAATRSVTVFAGCLRNATAVGLAAAGAGRGVTVVAAGEHWPDGSLRPADEDLLGAGAILEAIGGDLSPEAWLARAAFRSARTELAVLIADGESGRELRERGFADDVRLATQLDVSRNVPVLRDGRYRSE